MANVQELFPYSINTGGNDTLEILAYYGNNLVRLDAGTGIKFSIASEDSDGNATKIDAESFMGKLFVFSKSFLPFTYNRGTSSVNRYYDDTPLNHTPLATIIKKYNSRLYLANVAFFNNMETGATTPDIEKKFNNRVFYSNLPVNEKVEWGFAYGSSPIWASKGDLIYYKSDEGSTSSDFLVSGLKPGDPLFILDGINKGQHTIKEIVSNGTIRLTESIKTLIDFNWWAGSNWFDVDTEDNDYNTALEENNNRLMIFKRNSLHRYSVSGLVKVKGAPGTTSKKSVINIGDNTIYYHEGQKNKTGFYLYDGVSSKKISNAIQPFVDGIVSGTEPVAWREGEVYRAYVGDIDNVNSSNPAYNISKDNVVLTYNSTQNRWFVDTISETIISACTFIESGTEKTIVGNSNGEVFQMGSGNSDDDNDIPFKLETQPYYPRGSEIMSMFTRIKIVSRDARGVSVSYKLWDTPLAVDSEYYGLGDIEDHTTEFVIPTDHNLGCGIQLLFTESGKTEPNYHMEKISIYHDSDTIQTPERKDQR